MEISRSASPGREDDALLADLRAGKDEAFARLLRNEEDARDAVQEALISAFRSIDRFEGAAASAPGCTASR